MANIPQNESYGTPAGTTPITFRNVPKFTPSTTYQNLARINASGGIQNPTPPAAPGTPEYYNQKQAGIFQYGNLVNNGQGIPTQTQFLPPADPRATTPIPADYGKFADPMTINSNGQNLSWGTPINPAIRNLSGDTPGQYVVDLADPNKLVKTVRGSNPTADFAMRSGRPGSMYTIDHIIPLSLGGADTLANRQLLTYEQNDQKTKAQAIPYTLYSHGKISLNEARVMAMQWKDRDLSDVPLPDKVGLVPIDIAQQTAERWTKPKPVTIKDVIKGLPEANKNLGKGFLPDPIREFIKGVASGVTMNFIPYEQGENQGLGSKIAGITGIVAGTLAPWSLAAKVLMAPFAAARGIGALLGVRKAAVVAEAAASGFAGASEAAAVGRTLLPRTLSKAPGYVSKFLSDPALVKQAGHFAGTSAVFGQAQQFIANKFNPYTLSGEAPESEQKSVIGNIFKDMAIGAVTGVASPTLKGTAYSVVTPMALSFWANPDDPVEALTSGVLFGVMHATGTYKRPGYNDVVSFGGKPYQNPVTATYNHVMDHAALTSLKYYNPGLPESKVGQPIPKLTPIQIERAKNNAIKNVWERFLFQKDVAPADQSTILSQFKGFSKGVNKTLDNIVAPTKLTFLEKFSPAARRAKTAESKAGNEALVKEFGPGYQTQNQVPKKLDIDRMTIPEEGMDLQTALSEIKRITVSARQLYKGTLSTELRGKADLDDLLSYGKMLKDRNTTNLQNRFQGQVKFAGSDEPVINSPAVRQSVESMMKADPEFMTRSTNNSTMEPSGKYPVGDVALTGAAVSKVNIEKAKYYFEQKAAGNASPNVILARRSDLAPLFSMHNNLLTPQQIKTGDYAIDANPGNAIQAFGVVRNPQTKQIELVELGMIASDHRLNLATGKNHTAFNKHPGVLKYMETNGAEGMRPLTPENHKDTIAKVMDKNDLDILVANISPHATLETISSKNPYIPLKLNEENWIRSIQMSQQRATEPSVNPVSVDIAKVNSALDSKDTVNKINQMRNNPNRIKPASEYIPKQVIPVNPSTDRLYVPQETTRTAVQKVETAIDAVSPAEVKKAFQKDFGIILTEAQAKEVFVKRHELTMRDGIELLTDAARSGNADIQTKVSVDFIKTYVESGALRASPNGQATLDLPMLPKRKYTGTEDTPSPVVAENYSQRLTPEPTAVSKTPEAVTQKADIPTSVTPVEPTGGFADRIVTTAKTEIPKKVEVLPAKPDRAVEETRAMMEEQARQDTRVDEGQPHYSNKDVLTPEQFAQSEWIKINGGKIPAKGSQRRDLVQTIAMKMEEAFPSMELEQALGFTGRSLPELSGMSKDYVKAPLTKPGSLPGEYGKFIQEGLKMNPVERPQAHYFAKAFDKGLQDMLGKDYKKISRLTNVLDDYFKDITSREFNYAGKEITQPGDVLNFRATGERNKEIAAYGQRTRELTENPTEAGGTLTPKDLAELGVVPGDESGFFGMNVRPEHQDMNMVHDLTAFENLVGGLFAPNAKQNGHSAVEAVKDLFMGDKITMGLRQYIISRIPSARRSVSFDKLIAEAKANDVKAALASRQKAENIKMAEEQLPTLEKNLKLAEKALADPLERANWESKDYLEEQVAEITAKMKKFSKIMEELKAKDGGGGPGVHDGAGGIGSFFSGIGKGIKNAAQGVGDFLTGTIRYERPKETTSEKPTYTTRGVSYNDDDLDEISKILLGEVSNRDGDRKPFEVRHIVNTGINRVLAKNPKEFGGTLVEVFKYPGAYQSYAPKGILKKGGTKVIESEYQRAVAGNLDYPTQQKLKIIRETLEEMKNPDFADPTDGAKFYVHATDGTLWFGATGAEAKARALEHEKQMGIAKSQFGTANGMPAGATRGF